MLGAEKNAGETAWGRSFGNAYHSNDDYVCWNFDNCSFASGSTIKQFVKQRG
jgi:hypothetical protein